MQWWHPRAPRVRIWRSGCHQRFLVLKLVGALYLPLSNRWGVSSLHGMYNNIIGLRTLQARGSLCSFLLANLVSLNKFLVAKVCQQKGKRRRALKLMVARL